MSTYTYTVLNCRNYSDLYDYINKYISDIDLCITNNYTIINNPQVDLIFSYIITSDQVKLLDNIMSTYVPNNTLINITLNKSISIPNIQIQSVNSWCSVASFYFIAMLDCSLYNIILTSYTNSSSYKIRLYDTFNNKTIAISDTLTNNISKPITLSNLNLPCDNTVLELQVYQTNGTIYINSCNFLYANITNL